MGGKNAEDGFESWMGCMDAASAVDVESWQRARKLARAGKACSIQS